ncbi:hypothetical protein FQN54_005934 [Arachnomyces sp. PD_36]|nr:hypothetical protein FQN54_005934 [Arachnomyces sp. PD_36]
MAYLHTPMEPSQHGIQTTRKHNPASRPSGFDHLLHPQETPSTSPNSRLRLHIRQEPIAARACGAGDKDRRVLDPPPILQLLITDFSPDSHQDIDALNYNLYVVGCQLFSISTDPKNGIERRVHASNIIERVSSSKSRGVKRARNGESQNERSVQVLSGRTYVSPFFVEADPEPHRAPIHPRSSSPAAIDGKGKSKLYTPITPTSPTGIPSTFFVFADLSVRTSGTYRLRFRLMDVGHAAELSPGTSTPVLDEVWSQPFQVYAAKDFPGMRETPYLTEQLKGLGAAGLKTRRKEKGAK